MKKFTIDFYNLQKGYFKRMENILHAVLFAQGGKKAAENGQAANGQKENGDKKDDKEGEKKDEEEGEKKDDQEDKENANANGNAKDEVGVIIGVK